MKINFTDYINNLKEQFSITDQEFETEFSIFCEANNLTENLNLEFKNRILYADEQNLLKYKKAIEEYVSNYGLDTSKKVELLFKRFAAQFPVTADLYRKFSKQNKFSIEIHHYVLDFFLAYLPGEMHLSTDKEIQELVSTAYSQMNKIFGEAVTQFINFIQRYPRIKTLYNCVYFLPNYSDQSESSEAYEQHEYLKILYYMLNEDYILENDMYQEAVNSKNYADTWLFISLHFFGALRKTDLIRLRHPKLPYSPEEVLKKIQDKTFSDADARLTLYGVTESISVFATVPNKTKSVSNVSSIQFYVPDSAEVHMGTLFAIAEAHFQLSGKPQSDPLIREISSYEAISRYMGDEIGDLFLEANFRTILMNKSYLQMIYSMTDSVLSDKEDEFHVKGYILAALARSHKGSFGSFATTTSIYLKDAKMSGYSPKFVAKEMLERGALSLITSMLLKMVASEEYERLPIEQQSMLHHEVNISPIEAENIVSTLNQSIKQASQTAAEIYNANSKQEIVNILHLIGSGQAVSKMDSCLCLKTAMKCECPFLDRTSCIGCKYEIGTKSTVLLMAIEIKRLQNLYASSESDEEKNRYKVLASQIVGKQLNELLFCIKNEYGEKSSEEMKEIIRRVQNDK